MDYYPVKDRMTIRFRQIEQSELDRRFSIWRAEVDRLAANDDRVVIPEVRIRYPSATLIFEEVEVNAHNLREDVLARGTITALDAILSLGDNGAINYGVLWYESIGSVEVENYFVVLINNQAASGSCGFVHEAGEDADHSGNHIHVPPDMRILHSPEYVMFYWIELGPC